MSGVVYVVMECGGSYDDAYSNPVASSLDRATAERHAAELTIKNQKMTAAAQEVRDEFAKWSQTNVRPAFPANKMTIPRFTKEQRKQMGAAKVQEATKAAVDFNHQQDVIWKNNMDAWFILWYPTYVQIMQKHGLEPVELSVSTWMTLQGSLNSCNESYEVEEVPLI